MRRAMVGEPILGSSLTMVEAAVNNEDIDQFDFGTDWWATEVADEFKSRQNWADRHDLFLFYAGTRLVAGARLGFWRRPHPHRDSDDRARYYLILSFGVNVPFQGHQDPRSIPLRSYASVILDYVELRARGRADCVGLALHVRVENGRAQRLYRRHGFVEEADVFTEDDRATIEMRKLF
jgi:GNAT superfamily N-acetyltransferase